MKYKNYVFPCQKNGCNMKSVVKISYSLTSVSGEVETDCLYLCEHHIDSFCKVSHFLKKEPQLLYWLSHPGDSLNKPSLSDKIYLFLSGIF